MKISRELKIIIIFFIIYFFFAWILTANYLFTHSTSIKNGSWDVLHQSIGDGELNSSGDSNQFRLVSYWLAEFVHNFFDQPVWAAYLLNRLVVTFLIFCCFHLFLLKWFDHKNSFLGTMILAAITPITYMPYYQESDIYLQLFFLVGLMLIRDNHWLWLLPLVLIGGIIKETIIFLIPFHFLYNWRNNHKIKLLFQTIILFVLWGFTFYITRNLFYEGGNSSIWQLPHNIEGLLTIFNSYNPFVNVFLLVIPLFGLFWFMSFWDLKKKPHFFKVGAIFIIIFIFFHYILAWPEETRLILPLAFLIIPSALLSIDYLLGTENKYTTKSEV